MTRVTALILGVSLLATACGGAATTTTSTEAVSEFGGHEGFVEGTRERIAQETDCEILQMIFDASDEAHGRFADDGDLAGMEAHTAVMNAADERMDEVGCYDN